LEMLASRAKGRLQVDIPPALPDLLIDRLRIQHVVFALVQNAFEANAEHPAPRLVKITMDGDRYGVRTSVTDSGPGVPTNIQDQLFRPFFTTKPRGTGLGLASSRAIIEAHDGTIGFEDLPSGGSRFWFRLPAAVV
jgi:two-component system sensor histidine kinase DctS